MAFELTPFKVLIRERCGLLFEGPDEDKLDQHLRARMQATGRPGPVTYYRHLVNCTDEFQQLVNSLTVNETYFFRELEQIQLFTEKLAPRLLVNSHPAPVRILSAGCASGEEPYSLVMALWEKYGQATPRRFKVVACDIDSRILGRAREGRYTAFSFRGVSPEMRQRYFDKIDDLYHLKAHIRDHVDFHELNLLAPEAPALAEFDLIFFRNVSIYFDTPTRRLIQQKLQALLKTDGIVIIGLAETLANDLGVLPLVEEEGLFYFVKGQRLWPDKSASGPATPPPNQWQPGPPLRRTSSENGAADTPPAPLALPAAQTSRPAVAASSADAQISPQALIQLTADQHFDAALTQIEMILATRPEDHTALLLSAYIQINRKAFDQAELIASEVLAVNAWSVDALILLGLAAKWQQQPENALKWFKQAAYAHPECWPAHYYLADLYRQRGDMLAARRSWRVVLQLLDPARTPRTGIEIIPIDLPPHEIRFLCEHHLAGM